MPRGDGTGPRGQGPGTGQGRRQNPSRGGSGANRAGRMGGKKAAGPGGQCVCPSCGAVIQHQTGAPCYQIKCPKCGKAMARK